MFNPFKYRAVSQRDDEDEDVLYQQKYIPLSNLREVKSDDETEQQQQPEPRIPPTQSRRNALALCLLILIFATFIFLLIALITYAGATPPLPSRPEINFTTGHYQIMTSSAITVSSSGIVSSRVSVNSSTSLTPSSATDEAAIQSTASGVATNKLQSSSTVHVQGSKSTFSTLTSSLTSAAVLPALATPTLISIDHDIASATKSDIEPLSLLNTLKPVISTPVPTEGLITNNNFAEILDSMVSSLNGEDLIVSSVTADSKISRTEYLSVTSSYNVESTVPMPVATNFLTTWNNNIHWHEMKLEASSETTPFVIDVNYDGIDDIIYTYSHYTKDLSMYYCTSNMHYQKSCLIDTGHPVCGSILVAVNGLNGEVIWLRNLTRPVFGIRCVMDVDEDNEIDCFIIGRYHQWDAINKATGETIWEADTSIGFPGYNFYFPLPLEDFDGDGVVDILSIHGGDQSYGSGDTNRSPALIVILSGKTGKKLIDPITVPDGRESYMSPVRCTFANEDVIVFGTGGETINGSLWAITVNSIKEFLKSKPTAATFYYNGEYVGCRSEFMDHMDRFRPKYDETAYQLDKQSRRPSADCPSLGRHLPIINKYKLCLYEIYSSDSKGLIVPPVIIDMNDDDVQDLIVQSFNGHVLCFNGVNGGVLWQRYIPNSESYNVPAPLFYNDDNTPDIFLRVNIGEWDDYEYSYVVIIDGTDGTALWAMNSSYATMQSAVTLMSVNHSQDAVVFFAYNPIDTKNLSDATVKRQKENEPPLSTGIPPQTVSDQQGNDNEEPQPYMDIPPETLKNLNFKHLGEQFWNLTDGSFPDPILDSKGFIESCMHQSSMERQSHLYFITKNLANSDDVNVGSVAAVYPAILIPGYGMISSHDAKRHGDFQPSLEMLNSIRNDAWRCTYIQYPSRYSPVTPVLADLNHDGKFELIYSLQFASDDIFFALSVGHSIFELHVQTIENMLQTDLIDFSKFIPFEEQRWTTYMGSKGNGMYF